MSNWLGEAADLESKFEKAEYLGMMQAYKHCKELVDETSFTSVDNGRVVRVDTINRILDNLIEYHRKECLK